MQVTEMEKRFSYHAPTAEALPRFTRLRAEFYRLALMVDALAPESREQSLAFTALEEAMMWANAAIARNWEYLPPAEIFERRFGEKLAA